MWLKRAKVCTLLLIIVTNWFFSCHLPVSYTWRNEERLVLTSLDGRKGHLQDEGNMREGFGDMKNGMRRPEMNLIFKLFQNSALPICTYLGSSSGLSPTPWALLPLTGSEGRYLSFLRATSNQNKYKLLSSLQTSPKGFSGGNPWLLFRIELRVSVVNAWTANYTCLPRLTYHEQLGVNVS